MTTTTDHIYIDADNKKLIIGDGSDLQLYHTGARSEIINNTGDLIIQPGINSNLFLRSQTGAAHFKGVHAAQVELYWNGNKRLETSSVGVSITKDLDVDGHTNLDNVSIAGVTTTTGFIESVGTSGRGAKLGGLSVGYDSLYATIQPFTGTSLHLNYNAGTDVKIGAANTKVDLEVNGDIKPKADGNRDLGLTGTRFRAAYVDTYYGDGSQLTGITGTTINNNTNDYILTASGTANTINGEANLTMTGNILTFNTTANTHRIQNVATGDHYTELRFDSNRSGAGESLAFLNFRWDGDTVADIYAQTGSDTTNKDDANLIFRTSPSQGSIAERLRISSNGAVNIGTGSGSGGGGLAVYGGTTNNASGQDATLYVTANSNNDWGILLDKPSHEYGFRLNTPTSSTLAFAIYGGGSIKHQFFGNGNYTASGSVDSASDIKLK